VKGDTQSSKARQIFNKVTEKLATAGIKIGNEVRAVFGKRLQSVSKNRRLYFVSLSNP
jgi:hypothetical protein